MRKWQIIPVGSEVGIEVSAHYYQVTDDNIGGFFDENGKLKHSVPTDKVMVLEITDDEQGGKQDSKKDIPAI